MASGKGGAGKTTTAAGLATQAFQVGPVPVLLIDADPQGTLAAWWNRRPEGSGIGYLAVTRAQIPDAVAAAREEKRGTLIIDTPPVDTTEIEDLVKLADLVLIPVQPTPPDLERAMPTMEAVKKAGKPFAFVLTRAAKTTVMTVDALQALSMHGPVLGAMSNSVKVPEAWFTGRTVVETARKHMTSAEVATVWQGVQGMLKQERKR